MNALSFATGKACINEFSLPDGFYDRDNKVVDHAVTKISRKDLAWFWLTHDKALHGGWVVSASVNFLLQL